MGRKNRGRERLINCDACGRRIPRDKAISFERSTVYSTDLKTADDVRTFIRRENHYCPSCGKSLGIYEKKKAQMQRQRERYSSYGGGAQGGQRSSHGSSWQQ